MLKSAAEHPLSSRRILTGLLGAPIAHSASPAMHERTAEALGLRCHYQLIEVADASREELKFLLEGVRRLGFAGINVTFPYKEAVLDLLDELSPSAAMIGAVNTVVVRDGRLVGYNTDTSGFERAARDLLAASSHGPVALIGAGGVGKAIAFALAGLGVAELRIFDADRAKAEQLGNRVGELERQLMAQTTESEVVNRRVQELTARLDEQGRFLADREFVSDRLRTEATAAQKTEAEMLKYRNFGKKSLNEIKDKLQQLQLGLGMKFDPDLVDTPMANDGAGVNGSAEEEK